MKTEQFSTTSNVKNHMYIAGQNKTEQHIAEIAEQHRRAGCVRCECTRLRWWLKW